MSETRIKDFISGALGAVPEVGSFRLVGVSPGDEPERLGTYTLPDKAGDAGETSRGIATKAWRAAESHASCFEEKRRYRLEALQKDDPDADPVDALNFAIGVNSLRHDPDEPTERGIVSMLIKTVRDQNELILTSQQGTYRVLSEENENLRRHNKEIEHLPLEAQGLMNELRGGLADRDLQMLKEKNKGDQITEVIKLLKESGVGKRVSESLLTAIFGAEDKTKAALPAATDSKTGEKLSEVQTYQEKLRAVFRVVNRQSIMRSLPSDEDREFLDCLLGVGNEDPPSAEAFRETFAQLWVKLPKEVQDGMKEKLIRDAPALALELVEMVNAGASEALK